MAHGVTAGAPASARPVTPVQVWTAALRGTARVLRPDRPSPGRRRRRTPRRRDARRERLPAGPAPGRGAVSRSWCHRRRSRVPGARSQPRAATWRGHGAPSWRAALRAQGLGDVSRCTGSACRTPGSPAAARRCAPRCDPCSPTPTPTSRPGPATRTRTTAPLASPPPTSRRSPRTGWGYPIWMWAWLTPDDPAVPWDHAYLLELDAAALAAKRAALAAFTSQVAPGPDGSPPVLDPAMLAHADRPPNCCSACRAPPSAPVSRFAALYAGGADPWSADSWYERRKRAVVLASLPRERYGTAFEPGCGDRGADRRAARAARDGGLGVGPGPRRRRARPRPHRRAARGPGRRGPALPGAVPAAPIDLAVSARSCTTSTTGAVHATLDRTLAALRPGGDLVAVHWRGWPPEAPRDAAATHRMRARPARAHPGRRAHATPTSCCSCCAAGDRARRNRRRSRAVASAVGVVVPARDEQDASMPA